MNLNTEHRAITAALNSYREYLENLSEERLTQTPPMGGWSYAEVYDHIMKATLSSVIVLERCVNNTSAPTKKKLNFWGWFVMLTGRFPGKVKAPASFMAKNPALKIGEEAAKNLIVKCHKRIDELAGKINNALPSSRYPHPRLGVLNAEQWFKFIRIHLQHHLKQLNRIKNNFQNS